GRRDVVFLLNVSRRKIPLVCGKLYNDVGCTKRYGGKFLEGMVGMADLRRRYSRYQSLHQEKTESGIGRPCQRINRRELRSAFAVHKAPGVLCANFSGRAYCAKRIILVIKESGYVGTCNETYLVFCRIDPHNHGCADFVERNLPPYQPACGQNGLIGNSSRHLVGCADDSFWRNDVSQNKKVIGVHEW